jgi:hypothetical protein
VYRLWHQEDWQRRPVSRVYYWRGYYAGRGRGKDRDARLFCNPECALGFAALCWDAGMRIVQKET